MSDEMKSAFILYWLLFIAQSVKVVQIIRLEGESANSASKEGGILAWLCNLELNLEMVEWVNIKEEQEI